MGRGEDIYGIGGGLCLLFPEEEGGAVPPGAQLCRSLMLPLKGHAGKDDRDAVKDRVTLRSQQEGHGTKSEEDELEFIID